MFPIVLEIQQKQGLKWQLPVRSTTSDLLVCLRRSRLELGWWCPGGHGWHDLRHPCPPPPTPSAHATPLPEHHRIIRGPPSAWPRQRSRDHNWVRGHSVQYPPFSIHCNCHLHSGSLVLFIYQHENNLAYITARRALQCPSINHQFPLAINFEQEFNKQNLVSLYNNITG